MTNTDAERVSDIVAELRPAFVVDLPVSQAISALRDEGRFKSAEALNAWLVENNALKSAAMDIIEAQSKALAEAGMTTTVLSDIAAERERQKLVEGWTVEHDDGHDHQELARAAACYVRPDDVSWTDNFGRALDDDGLSRPMGQAELRRAWSYVRALRWPWAKEWWKPSDTRRNLIKAAALIVAEIERLDRLTPTPENPNG